MRLSGLVFSISYPLKRPSGSLLAGLFDRQFYGSAKRGQVQKQPIEYGGKYVGLDGDESQTGSAVISALVAVRRAMRGGSGPVDWGYCFSTKCTQSS